MSCTTTITPEPPNPTLVFRRAINVMLNFAQDLLGRIKGAAKLKNRDHLPKPWRHPQRAEQRLMRTLDWIFALSRTLAGDRRYLLPAPRSQPATPPKPGKPRAKPAHPQTERTEAEQEQHRELRRIRYMSTIFATQSTSRIARRIARRLGAKPGTDWWPEELLAITETPVAWAARNHRQATQPPAANPAPEPLPPQPAARADPTRVAFHRRE
jgi:hypothetical protein